MLRPLSRPHHSCQQSSSDNTCSRMALMLLEPQFLRAAKVKHLLQGNCWGCSHVMYQKFGRCMNCVIERCRSFLLELTSACADGKVSSIVVVHHCFEDISAMRMQKRYIQVLSPPARKPIPTQKFKKSDFTVIIKVLSDCMQVPFQYKACEIDFNGLAQLEHHCLATRCLVLPNPVAMVIWVHGETMHSRLHAISPHSKGKQSIAHCNRIITFT